MRTLVKRWMAVAVSVILAITGLFGIGASTQLVNAASNPYPEWQTINGVAMRRCTWYAWQQAYERTGIALPALGNGGQWFANAQAMGYNTGTVAVPNSIAVWEGGVWIEGVQAGHVSYVESVNGDKMYVTEGGREDCPATGGIGSKTTNSVVGAHDGDNTTLTLVGFIYLNNVPDNPNPPTPSVATSWTQSMETADNVNGTFRATISTNTSVTFSEAGMTVWQDGVQVGQASEGTNVSGYYMDMWYTNQELGMAMSPGHTYTYQFYAVANGQRYESEVYSYTTPAPEPVQQQNQWTQELSMEGWTYGESANAPTASAQYGEVVFTYSDAEDGIYSAEIPTNAGIYYVKAEVAETSEYTGLTAITSFTIDRAISELPDVGELNAIYGQQLSEIALPDGMTWSENQGKEFDGTVGDCQTGKLFYADYTPADTKNYVGLRGQPIPVNVLPRDISDLELPQITADTNLEELSLSLVGLELVLDRDYTVSQQTKEETGEVIVTIEGTGNYTGMVSTSYTLPEEPVNPSEEGSDPSVTPDHNDGNNNPTNTGTASGNSATNGTEAESDVPQTGDNTVFSITAIAAVMLLSGCGIVIAVKQRKKSR